MRENMIKKQQLSINFSKLLYAFLGTIIIISFGSNPVLAQNLTDVAESMIVNNNQLPGVITGLSYLIGLAFVVYGVIKTKDHVENPNQTALRYPVISYLIGGALFALPIIYESMDTMINNGVRNENFSGISSPATIVSAAAGAALTGGGNVPVQAFAHVLNNIILSVEGTPGLVTGISYLLGLLMGTAGLLKIKEHVEEPNRAPLKDGVVRLVVGGMLFSVPTIYSAMLTTIAGGGGEGGIVGGILTVASNGYMVLTTGGLTAEAGGAALGGGCIGNAVGGTISAIGAAVGTGATGPGLGSVICNLFTATTPMTAFLTAIAYLFGLVVGLWGILKIKEHVENPSQVSVWDPVAKLVVAGGFFALPYIVGVAYTTVALLIAPHTNLLQGDVRNAGGPAGLDGMLAALVDDIFAPMSVIINWFALVAGFILVFIGISRLMKSAQEGARGPGGIGTIMTFITGGALLAFGPMITTLSTSLFTASGVITPNVGKLRYTAGMDFDAIARAESVIDAIILFVMILGFVSVARGMFIMRGVAEGSSQASMMSAVTHLIGGAIAINLAPFLDAVQSTLGIAGLGLGINFGVGLAG